MKSRLSDQYQLEKTSLTEAAQNLRQQMDSIMAFAAQAAEEDPTTLEVAARDFAYSLAQVYTGMCVQFVCWLHVGWIGWLH